MWFILWTDEEADEEASAMFDSFWPDNYQQHQWTGGGAMGGLPLIQASLLGPPPSQQPKFGQGGAESVKTRLDQLAPSGAHS